VVITLEVSEGEVVVADFPGEEVADFQVKSELEVQEEVDFLV
jgi:hypothetical protein